MKIAALIPCKKGSKGVPDKNFRELAGKTMWHWTLDAAQESGVFDLIVVSSNGGLDKQGLHGDIFYRNDEPGPGDISSLDDLMLHYANNFSDVDIWVLLQPTSVLRTSDDIKEAFRVFIDNDVDSVVSMTSVGDKYWLKMHSGSPLALYDPCNRMMRQNPKTDILYYENGAIYIAKRWLLQEKRCRIGGKVGFYLMPPLRSWQIDSPYDWDFCEMVLKRV